LKGYSCTSNLLVFLENVTTDIDAGRNVDTVYLDLAKAFDKIPHQRLLIKLKAHNIDGLVCNWINGWLSDRWQRVSLDGAYSSWRWVWSGVPQGSVLGPILFLIFIMISITTKIYRTVTNQEDGQRLQKDLDTVVAWAVRWQMKFNVEKCEVLHYGRNSIGCQYNMYGQPLAEATAEKDLGVVFSNDLKVVHQCREAYSKANQILGLGGF